MGESADLNLYRFVYNAPINFVDPHGLWGVQFGSVNIGVGNPNLAFSNDSWTDIADGAAAMADGLTPGIDPFSDLYEYGDPFSENLDPYPEEHQNNLQETKETGERIACLIFRGRTGKAGRELDRLGAKGEDPLGAEGRKKQGREVNEKKRQNKSWKPAKSRKPMKGHTPGRDHRRHR